MNYPGFNQQVIFLTVSDLEASSKFYGETLGLRLARDQGTCRIYHLCDASYVGVCKGEPPQWPNGLTFTLVSDDVDGWYKHLNGLGVKIRNPPKLNEKYQIYHFYLTDPDGYTLEIQRFVDPLE
ncbi:MAG: VOC family protein [Deltaproteobacteria bacterium]|nr:VOC family protein [Deltaproteobacteria bacterium]